MFITCVNKWLRFSISPGTFELPDLRLLHRITKTHTSQIPQPRNSFRVVAFCFLWKVTITKTQANQINLSRRNGRG